MRNPLLPGNDWKRQKAQDRSKLREMEKAFDNHYERLKALYGAPVMTVKYKVSYARLATDALWHFSMFQSKAAAEAMKMQLQTQGYRVHITETYVDEKS